MSNRKWLFDVEILCPMCGSHTMSFQNMTCTKRRETLNEKYFVILKFLEIDDKIKKLEKIVFDEKELSGSPVEGKESEGRI